MIAAVQSESSAMDSMRDKVKELDTLKGQVSTLTKKLLEADQANIQLKSSMVKMQEAHGSLRKSKSDIERQVGPLRHDLQKAKDAYSKERTSRLAMQQELGSVKEKVALLERSHEELEREVKTIPSITESNDILKSDLQQLRQRYKEDRSHMQKTIRQLESQCQELESNRSEIRNITLRLLDTTGTGSEAPAPVGAMPTFQSPQQTNLQPLHSYSQQPLQQPLQHFPPAPQGQQYHQQQPLQQQGYSQMHSPSFQLNGNVMQGPYRRAKGQRSGGELQQPQQLSLISGMASLQSSSVGDLSAGGEVQFGYSRDGDDDDDDYSGGSSEYDSISEGSSYSDTDRSRTPTGYTRDTNTRDFPDSRDDARGLSGMNVSNLSISSVKSNFIVEGMAHGGDNFMLGDLVNEGDRSTLQANTGTTPGPYEKLKARKKARSGERGVGGHRSGGGRGGGGGGGGDGGGVLKPRGGNGGASRKKGGGRLPRINK